MPRWEYTHKAIPVESLKKFLKLLDEAGQDGWELATLSPLEFELQEQGQIVIKTYLAIFKRPE